MKNKNWSHLLGVATRVLLALVLGLAAGALPAGAQRRGCQESYGERRRADLSRPQRTFSRSTTELQENKKLKK